MTELSADAPLGKPAGPAARWMRSPTMRRLLSHRGFVFGATIVILMTVVALMADFLVRHNPTQIQMRFRFVAPGDPVFWFGTDNLGRDLFSRVVMGARVSLKIGFLVMIFSGLLGTAIG